MDDNRGTEGHLKNRVCGRLTKWGGGEEDEGVEGGGGGGGGEMEAVQAAITLKI